MSEERYSVETPLPETPAPEGYPAPWAETRVVGERLPRVDAYERLSGAAVYPSDVQLPGMLYGAVLRCPHPHARVSSVDVGPAEAMPGVHAVLTPDSPEAEIRWNYRLGVSTAMFDRHCRFEGETVAAVAAETPHQAFDALRAISVAYEILPFASDAAAAADPSAPPVHEGGNLVGEVDTSERGDLEAGFAEADAIVETGYRSACEVHSPLERHGCAAAWDGPRLTIWESTQGVYNVQILIARTLGLPLSNVRVIGRYMGGGFGSKLTPGKYTAIAALLAKRAARPVKLFLPREDCFTSVGNRPETDMTVKIGATREGRLTAIDFTSRVAAGAYYGGGTGGVDWQARDLYKCANARTRSDTWYTHSGPARAMRAPGFPQGSWALEQALDSLANSLDMDPVDLRLGNIPTVSQAREGTPPYSTTGLAECLRMGAETFGWKEARAREPDRGPLRRGVGMAAGMWYAGGGWPPATIVVKLFADGSANLNMGASDLGTGTKTIMAMIVAEELSVPLEKIQIEHADTATTQFASASGGSKTVPTEAPAVRDAAVNVKRQLLDIAAEEMEVPASDLYIEGAEVVSRSDETKRIQVSALAGLRRRALLVGVGYRGPNPENLVVNPFGAQFCEVEVNMRTGEVRLLRFVAAHDSGRVMNHQTYDNQVFGGITMGAGLALTEERVTDAASGKVLNRNLHDYKIPTALDIPAGMVSRPFDRPDPAANTSGAKGLGEPVTVPTAAAIANAVFNATGVRVTESPITPGRLLELFEKQRREA